MYAERQSTRQRTGTRVRRGAPLALAVAAVALTAACGGTYGGTSTAASSAAASPSDATAATVATAATGLGTILVDGTGRTVYEFAKDTGSTSTCNGGCASIWPPVVAPSTLPPSLPGVTGQLGSTTRTDGSTQLTVAGHPVYTYSGDGGPGDTNGQGLVLNGGVWNVVSPAGSPVTTNSSVSPGSY